MLYCEILISVRLELQRRHKEQKEALKQIEQNQKRLQLKVIEEDSDFGDSSSSAMLRDDEIADDLRM